jgi:hypothetical protein
VISWLIRNLRRRLLLILSLVGLLGGSVLIGLHLPPLRGNPGTEHPLFTTLAGEKFPSPSRVPPDARQRGKTGLTLRKMVKVPWPDEDGVLEASFQVRRVPRSLLRGERLDEITSSPDCSAVFAMCHDAVWNVYTYIKGHIESQIGSPTCSWDTYFDRADIWINPASLPLVVFLMLEDQPVSENTGLDAGVGIKMTALQLSLTQRMIVSLTRGLLPDEGCRK